MEIRGSRKLGNIIKILLVPVLMAVFLIWGNNGIVVKKHIFYSSKIPESFQGFRIVQISDLHNKEFGKDQRRLLHAVSEQEPDIIVITGDLIDSRHTDMENAMDFIRGAVGIADVYFIAGNNDIEAEKYGDLKKMMRDERVIILENQVLDIVNETGDAIRIAGLAYSYSYKEILGNMSGGFDPGMFTVLLAHQPERLEQYAGTGTELVFAGHAHGGQIRIPFVGGLVAPGQGLFPKYTEGIYSMGTTAMVVSRGLGNSIIPLRIFNTPEVVVVILTAEN